LGWLGWLDWLNRLTSSLNLQDTHLIAHIATYQLHQEIQKLVPWNSATSLTDKFVCIKLKM
jgi:hypothetical protein